MKKNETQNNDNPNTINSITYTRNIELIEQNGMNIQELFQKLLQLIQYKTVLITIILQLIYYKIEYFAVLVIILRNLLHLIFQNLILSSERCIRFPHIYMI